VFPSSFFSKSTKKGLFSVGQMQIELHGGYNGRLSHSDVIGRWFEGADACGLRIFHKELNIYSPKVTFILIVIITTFSRATHHTCANKSHVGDMFTGRHLPTLGQCGYRTQRHTTAGTAAPTLTATP